MVEGSAYLKSKRKFRTNLSTFNQSLGIFTIIIFKLYFLWNYICVKQSHFGLSLCPSLDFRTMILFWNILMRSYLISNCLFIVTLYFPDVPELDSGGRIFGCWKYRNFSSIYLLNMSKVIHVFSFSHCFMLFFRNLVCVCYPTCAFHWIIHCQVSRFSLVLNEKFVFISGLPNNSDQWRKSIFCSCFQFSLSTSFSICTLNLW